MDFDIDTETPLPPPPLSRWLDSMRPRLYVPVTIYRCRISSLARIKSHKARFQTRTRRTINRTEVMVISNLRLPKPPPPLRLLVSRLTSRRLASFTRMVLPIHSEPLRLRIAVAASSALSFDEAEA